MVSAASTPRPVRRRATLSTTVCSRTSSPTGPPVRWSALSTAYCSSAASAASPGSTPSSSNRPNGRQKSAWCRSLSTVPLSAVHQSLMAIRYVTPLSSRPTVSSWHLTTTRSPCSSLPSPTTTPNRYPISIASTVRPTTVCSRVSTRSRSPTCRRAHTVSA